MYVQAPKAAFGTLEDSLNASSLALSPWLCVFFKKRQERQAWWNALYGACLKQSSTRKSVTVFSFHSKMLLSEIHRELVCIITLQARSLSPRAYHYLNLSQVIICLHAELQGQAFFPPRKGCSRITLNGSLISSSGPGRRRAKGSVSKCKEHGLERKKDDLQIPAPLPMGAMAPPILKCKLLGCWEV